MGGREGFWWIFGGIILGIILGCVVEAAMYSGHFRGVSVGFYMPSNHNLAVFIDFFINCDII